MHKNKQLTSKAVTPVNNTPSAIISFVGSYVLPTGWKTIECNGDTRFLLPEEENQNCEDRIHEPEKSKSSDFASMGVYTRDLRYIDLRSCANTIRKRENSNDPYPANEYSCQEVQIDGKNGLRQVGTHTTQSFQVNGVPSMDIYYEFPTQNGEIFEVSYIHYSKSTYPDHATDFDNFVKSFKFR